jgi:hypothetical protein
MSTFFMVDLPEILRKGGREDSIKFSWNPEGISEEFSPPPGTAYAASRQIQAK